jgi:hypothetical protein
VSAHLGGLQAMAGDFRTAETLLKRARSIYTELGRAPSLTLTSAPIEARVACLKGDVERAASIYLKNCEELVATRGGFHLVTQAAELADLLQAHGGLLRD